MKREIIPVLLALSCASFGATAATLHVWQESPSPSPPYATWETAAHIIQDAVDSAQDGDTVWVTDGVYDLGGRGPGEFDTTTNRVRIDRGVTLRSVNGPTSTWIVGAPAPGGGIGEGATRCVYLGAGAVLSGFTLTNGYTRSIRRDDGFGGGVLAASTAIVTNCLLTGNFASWGGGASGGMLFNCRIIRNTAYHGGGISGGTSYNCVLSDNLAFKGGGSYGGTRQNCTIINNTADDRGGGAFSGTLRNCIVYFNQAPEDLNYSAFNLTTEFTYSCTSPKPPGIGNIDADPLLATTSHLALGSPCIGVGSPGGVTGLDIDGTPWLDPPCMGADQVAPGQETDSLIMDITPAFSRVTVGFKLRFTANNEGPLTMSIWDFGDGVFATNQPYASHQWDRPGVYPVLLTGHRDALSHGITVTTRVEVVQQSPLYVSRSNANPEPPYDTWEKAATSIQDAIEESWIAGQLILVTNGVYDDGGVPAVIGLTNRVSLHKPVLVQSVSGPEVTTIVGAPPDEETEEGAVRCAFVGADAILSGFTLTNGYAETRTLNTEQFGGGARLHALGLLTNCVLTGNMADYGGGAFFGTLRNCLLTNNHAFSGGGAKGGTLYDCEIFRNTAAEAGGVAHAALYDSVVKDNAATSYGAGGVFASTLHGCEIVGNSAAFGGGALRSSLTNCFIVSNISRRDGGGADSCRLDNCILSGNLAWEDGGGIEASVAFNCVFVGNSARDDGGAADDSQLFHCTIFANGAGGRGDGVVDSSLYNSIVYANGNENYDNCSLSHCWLANPAFVNLGEGDFRLTHDSPCIDTGAMLALSPLRDFDGKPRAIDGDGDGSTLPDIGAFEYGVALEIIRAGHQAVLSWVSSPGETFYLEETPSLSPPFWTSSNASNSNPMIIDLSPPQRYYRLTSTRSFQASLVWISPGSFVMGSPSEEEDRDRDEDLQTLVTISQGFWVGRHEVTQEQFEEVMGFNPSSFKGDPRRPVERVTWRDATNFCARLTLREREAGRIGTDQAFRLPTEAEWEYACRAGTSTRFSHGDDPGFTELSAHAWYRTQHSSTTHPVGQKIANPWGLGDMHGNVYEWCSDRYGNAYPGGEITDPTGASSGSDRVLRGGSWRSEARYCRSANRYRNSPAQTSGEIGFRVVLARGQR